MEHSELKCFKQTSTYSEYIKDSLIVNLGLKSVFIFLINMIKLSQHHSTDRVVEVVEKSLA